MAKSQKKPRKKTSQPDVLGPALSAFRHGDYPEAREHLARLTEEHNLAEGEQKMASDFKRASRLEPGALWAGLACFGLFVLVIVIAGLKQP